MDDNTKPYISLNDILQIKNVRTQNGKATEWYLKGQLLTPAQIKNIKQEAEFIQKTQFWQLLTSEARYHAQRRAIIEATPEDIERIQEFHKVAVHFDEFIHNIIKN